MVNDKKKVIVFLGPQGSGKGTQAQLLGYHLSLPVVSMGDLIRDEIRAGGEQADLIQDVTNAGKLISHEITINLFKDWVQKNDSGSGFIIDGFPRVVEQQTDLQKFCPPTDVFVLEISDELALERLAGRLICKCGMIYHEVWNPPKVLGKCDVCGDKLIRREDDKPEAIKERLSIYHKETKDVLDNYEKIGVLRKVDASLTIPVIHASILKYLDK